MLAPASGSAKSFSAVRLFKNDDGLPVSTVTLINELPALIEASILFCLLSKSTTIYRLFTSFVSSIQFPILTASIQFSLLTVSIQFPISTGFSTLCTVLKSLFTFNSLLVTREYRLARDHELSSWS